MNRIAIVVALALAAFWVIGGGMMAKDTSRNKVWHYRMTVVVETPEGVKTGSAVREVVYRGQTRGGGGPGLDIKCKGEAVAVDLGKRGVLFALLGSDYCTDIILWAFNKKGDPTLRPDDVPKEGRITLSLDQYPIFMRFRDRNIPTTAERLMKISFCRQKVADGKCSEKEFGVVTDARANPFIEGNGFEDAFGQGVKLKEVTIEMTNDPVTLGIERWLPWLQEYYGKMLDGQRFNTIKSNYPFANSLSSGAFSTEVRHGR